MIEKGVKMKIAFMGNGVRIRNVLKCLIADCFFCVYHVKSGQYLKSSLPVEILNFMLNVGFSNVFILRVEHAEGSYV